MTQTNNRLFDEFARLLTDATGVAQGLKRETETIIKTQAEKFLADMDLVRRDEFEAVKEMAANARAENEALAARIAVLEAKIGGAAPAKRGTAKKPATRKTATRKSSRSTAQ
ncbi:MAG: accessory factor UbiK family protein [Hyphomicrobiales bacterium]|nr:accessory factor UbiK family protein [Hyphomicrobiales bacterium]